LSGDKLIFNRILVILLGAGLAAGSLSGCGSSENSDIASETFEESTGSESKEDSDTPELIEPEGVATNFDYASYRNIYDADVYSCVLAPSVKEYLYTSDEAFGSYGRLPGDEVLPGDVLMYSNTDELEEEKKQKLEANASKLRDYNEQMTQLYEDLYDTKKEEWLAAENAQKIHNFAPAEDSSWYEGWSSMYLPFEGRYKTTNLSRRRIEESIKEAEELHALETEYDNGVISRIDERITQAYVSSEDTGHVVSINYYVSGDQIPKNNEVMAIGNLSDKIFRTEYISTGVINKAEDIYAVVDGTRYELTYVPMEKEEYSRLKKKNDTVYSEFYVSDPDDKLKMGDFGDIIIMNKSATNVLTVPVDAVKQENGESVAYIVDGDDSTPVKVTTGIKDGMYVEILSGLSAGDKVLTEKSVSGSKKTQVLSKGSISSEFKESAYIYYPNAIWMSNPAKNGTFYINELCVAKYQHVEAGQELVKIEVVSDGVALKRLERQLQRQRERLATLNEKKSKIYSDEVDRALERAIRQRNSAIEQLTKDIAELKQYTGIVSIVSPCEGIVTDITELKAGDLIYNKTNLVQVADVSDCYIVVEDEQGRLSYGNKATVTFKGDDGKSLEAEGMVVTVNSTALSKPLQSGYALISLSKEDILQMAELGSSQASGGRWNRSRFNVSASIRSVDNVLLVPKTAVMEKNGDTFVKVNTDEGIGNYVSFVAGGSDNNNFWVAYGLEEGMEICLE